MAEEYKTSHLFLWDTCCIERQGMYMKRTLFQVYVTHSREAVARYQEAFDVEIMSRYLNKDGSYYHCELNIYGQILAVSEHKEVSTCGNTMQLCLHFEKGEEALVQKAYEVLRNNAQILHALGPCDYCDFMTDLIDVYGVRWCLFVD